MVWVIPFCSPVAELNRWLGTPKLSGVNRLPQARQVHIKSPRIHLHTPPNPTCSWWYDHEWLKADYKPDSPTHSPLPATSALLSVYEEQHLQLATHDFSGRHFDIQIQSLLSECFLWVEVSVLFENHPGLKFTSATAWYYFCKCTVVACTSDTLLDIVFNLKMLMILQVLLHRPDNWLTGLIFWQCFYILGIGWGEHS